MVKFLWAIVDTKVHGDYYYDDCVFVTEKNYWKKHKELQSQYTLEEDKALTELLRKPYGFNDAIESVFKFSSMPTETAIKVLESISSFEHSYTMQEAVRKGLL